MGRMAGFSSARGSAPPYRTTDQTEAESSKDLGPAMHRLLLFFSTRPWLGLGLLLLGSVIAALPLERLGARISAEQMLVEGDPQRGFYAEMQALFGDEQLALLVVEDPRPLQADRLEQLRAVLQRIEQLPYIERTESLFDIPHVRSVDGYLDKSPYLAELPSSDTAETELLAAARANPLLNRVVVSPDHSAMAAALVFNERVADVPDDRLTRTLERAIEPLSDHYERVYTIGFAQVRDEIASRIVSEQRSLMPFAIGALMLALFLLLRQLLDVLTPLLTAGLSILWTLGLMAWLEVPLNVVTSTIPILLLVVGSTEDVHLLAEFRRSQRAGNPVDVASAHMARKLGRTVLLTFITTWAGFLSVGLSGIEALRQFGLIASTGLLFNFVITVILVPSALTLAGRWQLDGARPPLVRKKDRLARRYWDLLCRHRRAVVTLMVLLAALAMTGVPRIDLQHNPIDSLGDDSAVARDIQHLNTHFAGLESFSVVLDAGIQDTFLHARYLDQLARLQAQIQALMPEASVTSFADYLTLLNRAFLEDPTASWPQSNEEIAELMLFLEHDRVAAYVGDDYSRARIVVRHALSDTAELQARLERIGALLEDGLDRGLTGRLTGDSVLALSATDSLVVGQLQSVLLIVVLFVVIVSVLFTDLRVGLVAALPNLLPVVVLFGVMGYAGIPLNIGTAMAAAVAIGIAVDDTLHFMLRYNRALRGATSQATAMRQTLRAEALPVFATSVALIGGFLVFTLSDFEPVAQFGWLGALVIATALLADFVITPMAIVSLRLITLWELLSPEVRQQVIPKSALFHNMRPWQIRKFVASSTQLEFPAGATVYRRNDASQALYLVIEGQVEVRVPGRDGQAPAVVDRFGPGQVFGDVAVLADVPRRTDAIATLPTTLMVLTREGIENVTFLHPFIASRLFLNLARDVSVRWATFIMRVRRADSDISERDDS
jgi:predicted RND superfamily exporter protein